MKKRFCGLWVVLLIFSLVGCEWSGTDFLPALEGEFCYTLRGRCSGVDITCVAEGGAVTLGEDGTPTRTLSVTFTAPRELAGMVIVCERFSPLTGEAVGIKAALGDLELDSTVLRGFLTPAFLLASQLEVTKTATETREGRTVCLVTASDGQNTRTVGVDPNTSQILTLAGIFHGIVFDGTVSASS